jgi:hypothetical protein
MTFPQGDPVAERRRSLALLGAMSFLVGGLMLPARTVLVYRMPLSDAHDVVSPPHLWNDPDGQLLVVFLALFFLAWP